MQLPSATLPYGFVFVYGSGVEVGVYNNQFTNTMFRFATIYGVGVNMGSSMIGNSIGFDSTKIVCQLAWANYPYSVLPTESILCTEVYTPLP